MGSNSRPIILDVDTGIDDAWAIAYALNSPTLDVLGITTGYGNADVETTTHNTLLMVQLLGRDTPVYRGAERPLVRPWDGPVPSIHGQNGMGDVILPALTRHAERLEAAQFILDAVQTSTKKVTLVAVARLTNVARVLLYDPTIKTRIDRIILMGGAAFCPGNVSAVAEANIWGDPEAADLVFQSGIPITMVGLDVTMKTRLTRRDLEHLDPSLPVSSILKEATNFYINAYQHGDASIDEWCPLHDPLAVAVAEEPSLIHTHPYSVRVETKGEWTDGMTVVDARQDNPTSPIEVAIAVDSEAFLQKFRQRLHIGL